MKADKRIRQMPWPEPWYGGNQDFIVTLAWPVIDHERLLVATFIRNREKKHWYRETGPDFRLICSKKEKRARVLCKDARAVKRLTLREAIGGFHASPDTCHPEISRKDEEKLGKWLHFRPDQSHNHLIPQLADWVKDAVEAEIQEEKFRRGEIMDEDVKLCPEELPEGLIGYIRNVVLPQDNVLIYKKGNVRGTCYLCREKVRARGRRFKQSEFVTCPNCGERVYALLEGSDRFRVDYVENIAAIQKGTDGATVFIRQWHLNRDPTAQWNDIAGQLEEVARYAVRGNKAAKWQREAKENYYMNTYRYKLSDWTRMGKVHAMYDNGCYLYIPDNWREVFAGTSLQYCDLEDYAADVKKSWADRCTVRLMMDWVRYPAVEKFWKAGYTGLVHEKLRGFWARHRYAINWGKGSIAEAIKFPKRLLKLYQPAEWTMDKMQRAADIWEMVESGKIREGEMRLLMETNLNFKEFQSAFGHAGAGKILRYAGSHTVYIYRDYLRDCAMLGWNLDDQAILFPKNLDAAHQRSIAQVKYEADKAANERFKTTRAKGLWQEWEQGDLLIRWPTSGNEIINEGEALKHCVGGYVERAAQGKTTILFIRKKSDPGKPFYTLEWCDDRVIQCKSYENRDYKKDPDVAEFVDAWVKHLKGLKQYKKKEKAA